MCTLHNVNTCTSTHWAFANVACKKYLHCLGVIACYINLVKACNYQKVAGNLEQFRYVLYEEILIHVNTNLDSRILNIHYILVKVKPKALFWAFAPIRVPKN